MSVTALEFVLMTLDTQIHPEGKQIGRYGEDSTIPYIFLLLTSSNKLFYTHAQISNQPQIDFNATQQKVDLVNFQGGDFNQECTPYPLDNPFLQKAMSREAEDSNNWKLSIFMSPTQIAILFYSLFCKIRPPSGKTSIQSSILHMHNFIFHHIFLSMEI